MPIGHVTDLENKVVNQVDIYDEEHVHQLRPQFLKDLGVDVLIMNSMGKGAYNRLIALNINTCVLVDIIYLLRHRKSFQTSAHIEVRRTANAPLKWQLVRLLCLLRLTSYKGRFFDLHIVAFVFCTLTGESDEQTKCKYGVRGI